MAALVELDANRVVRAGLLITRSTLLRLGGGALASGLLAACGGGGTTAAPPMPAPKPASLVINTDWVGPNPRGQLTDGDSVPIESSCGCIGPAGAPTTTC